MGKFEQKNFSGSHPPVSASFALYPCHPFANQEHTDNQAQCRVIRSFATPLRVNFGRFLIFRRFHACNYLKINNISVKFYCSTQHHLTLCKDKYSPAYLQAFQRVCVRFLLFSQSGHLCVLCRSFICALCRRLFSHTGLRVQSVKNIHTLQP